MRLTARQEEVLRQMAECKSSKEIAYALRVSHKTIEDHILRIRRKTGLSTEELPQLALVLGLASISANVAIAAAKLKPDAELHKRWVQRRD